MKILIVSGFLGAGKTSFIKELIRRSGIQPVVLENEYGAGSIDSRELSRSASGSGELKILEFMEGCVCCTMKDSFVNSVMTIFSGLDPEYLIIEPTGVGRLSNILNNLAPLLHGNIQLLQPLSVISPAHFHSNMAQWPELCRDQLAHAETIIFSKCEREDPAILAKTASEVRKINPRARILEEHYSRQADDFFRHLLKLPALKDPLPEASHTAAPAEGFSQLTLNHARLESPLPLILLLEDCLRGHLGQVVRAKGTIPCGREMLRFDLADQLYAITGSEDSEGQCVFIGRQLDQEALARRLGSSWEAEHTGESLSSSFLNKNKPASRGALPRRPSLPLSP